MVEIILNYNMELYNNRFIWEQNIIYKDVII